MPLETHDLALALDALAAGGGTKTTFTPRGFELTLVHIAATESYTLDAPVPATLLVLEGAASVAIDDWRATLSGGLLASVPAQSRLVVTADAGAGVSLLLTRAAGSEPTVVSPPGPSQSE